MSEKLPQHFTNSHEAQDAYAFYRHDGMRSIALLCQGQNDWIVCRDADVAKYISQGYAEVVTKK